MSFQSSNPFDQFNDRANDDGFTTVQRKRRTKKAKKNKRDPTQDSPPRKPPQTQAIAPPTVVEEPTKPVEIQLEDKLISYFVDGSSHVNKKPESDVVAVLKELQSEGYPLVDPNAADFPEFTRELLQRIHVREKSRLENEDEADDEVQNDEDTSTSVTLVPTEDSSDFVVVAHPESVEEKQMEHSDGMSLNELTEKQVRELDFNGENAESILKDWVQKISSSESSVEIRNEFSKTGALGYLSERILTSEIQRTEDSPRQIRDYTDLLVQLFNHLLQEMAIEGYGWFVEQLIEIATDLKRSRALPTQIQTLVRYLKNFLNLLKKEADHEEEKPKSTIFVLPSERLFRKIDASKREQLVPDTSTSELDEAGKNWHESRDMISLETSKNSDNGGPSHDTLINLFREIEKNSQQENKRVNAHLKKMQRQKTDSQNKIDRIRNQTFSQQHNLEKRKKQIEQDTIRLTDRKKQLEQQLAETSSQLDKLSLDHMSVQESLRAMEAQEMPKLAIYKEELEGINVKIGEKSSERSCFEGVGRIANTVTEQLQSKNNGTRQEQAQFREKMNQQFVRSGRQYQDVLKRMKSRLDSQKTQLQELVKKYRELKNPFQSPTDREHLRNSLDGYNSLLKNVEGASSSVQKEIYDTQMELQTHEKMRNHTSIITPTSARSSTGFFGGAHAYQSLPPATHTPTMIYDNPEHYHRKPPLNPSAVFSTPILFKQHSISKPPQASYNIATYESPTQQTTFDNFHDQIPQDPIVVEHMSNEAPPLEATTQEDQPISLPIQPEEKAEPIGKKQSPPQPVEAQPRRVVSSNAPWANIAMSAKKTGGIGKIKQTVGVKLKNPSSRGRNSRGRDRYRGGRGDRRR